MGADNITPDARLRSFNLTNRRLIFQPPADRPDWVSHAQAPTVLVRSPHEWVVYCAGRDARNVSRTFAVSLDPVDFGITGVSAEPVLDVGEPEAFDAHGVGPGSAVADGDRILLYYTGIRQAATVPYEIAIGLAVSGDGGQTFRRFGHEPILAAGPDDPFGVTTPTVLRSDSGWSMLYSSFREWRDVDGRPEPIYDIRRAVSDDGIRWSPVGSPALVLAEGEEGGLIRPQVFAAGGRHYMIAAARGWRDFRHAEGAGYRVVGASSADGAQWVRAEGLIAFEPRPQQADWDSDMQAYPFLVCAGDRRWIFYNGNRFGHDGFGVAEMDERRTRA